MAFSLRMILLLVATILFVVAALGSAENWADWIAWGLAAVAAAFLVGEAGWDRSFGGPSRDRT
ncbi:MAG: hypothetical protein H0T20_01115 [Actinobacteria bacterium]|nr:hypothetical protein [Actinomycetota bacterium]